MINYIKDKFRGLAQLVERSLWEREATRSNRVSPTDFSG